MIVAVGAVVAKVAKKVLAILAGDKNGRKFLGYVVGIALFIVLLPVIAVYGLFGWMAGGGAAEIVSPDMVYSAMPAEYRERMEQYNAELSIIETTFAECGVSETDTSLAKTIYISCLIGKESEENFYRTYADCFLNADEEHDPLQNISSAFGVTFTDADKERLKQLYGGYTCAYLKSAEGKTRRFMKSNDYEDGGDDVFVEIPAEYIRDYRQGERREQYVNDIREDAGFTEISLYAMQGDGNPDDLLSGEELIADESVDVVAEVMHKMELETLRKALLYLSEDEYRLIYDLFLKDKPMTERELAKAMRIPRMTLNSRKHAIFEKLKKYF